MDTIAKLMVHEQVDFYFGLRMLNSIWRLIKTFYSGPNKVHYLEDMNETR